MDNSRREMYWRLQGSSELILVTPNSGYLRGLFAKLFSHGPVAGQSTLLLLNSMPYASGTFNFCHLYEFDLSSGKQFHEALELLASFKRGLCGGVKIKLGRLQVRNWPTVQFLA